MSTPLTLPLPRRPCRPHIAHPGGSLERTLEGFPQHHLTLHDAEELRHEGLATGLQATGRARFRVLEKETALSKWEQGGFVWGMQSGSEDRHWIIYGGRMQMNAGSIVCVCVFVRTAQ